MVVLNFFALILIAVISASFCKNKWFKAIVSFLFSVFLCMQAASLYVGGSFCDYKFFVHFNFRDVWWGATGIYKFEALMLPFALIGIAAGIFFISKLLIFSNKQTWLLVKSKILKLYQIFLTSVLFIRKALTSNKKRLALWVKLGIFGFSLIFLFVAKNGIVDGLKESYLMFSVSTAASFEDAVKNLETAIQNQNGKIVFTKKENLTVSAEGKNIIIIALESFEQAFLHDKNQDISPNLRKLKQEWNYFNMSQNKAGGWTVASLYTVFTGFPCYFTEQTNAFFQSTKKSKLVSLADVLGKVGYEMYYLSENATFSGTEDLLKTFGIQHVLDKKTFIDKYPQGLKDADIFTEAKNILKTSSPTKPVMIYIATLATHNPGVPDPRLYSIVNQQKTDLETAALQTDYLVGDFIDFLKQNKYLENTIVYIFPDHLFMGSPNILKTGEDRKLWFLTNANSKDLHIDTANFYQIDIPSNILSGAKITHNATFIGDYIKEDKNQFINENYRLLLAINVASLEREMALGNHFAVLFYNNFVTCFVDNDTLFSVSADSLIKYEQIIFLTNELRIQNVTSCERGAFDTTSWDTYYDIYIKIGIKNKKLDIEWGRDDVLKITFPPTNKLKMNSLNIQETLASIASKNVEIKQIEEIPKDTVLLDYLHKTLQNPDKVIVISCYDNASVHFSKLNSILEKAGVKESLTDCYRCSYLAVFSKNKVYFEKNGNNEAIYKKLNVEGVNFYISSGGFENPTGDIIIEGKNYGCRRRGLNFVIFNTQTYCVEDAFNVDFHGDETLKMNRCLR